MGKNFWLFRLGQMISLIGDQLAFIAISFYILSKTNSALKLSSIMIPAMLVSLGCMVIFGPLGDIFNRKKFIFYGNIIKAIIWICILFLLFENHLNIPILSFLYVLSGIGTAVIAAGTSGFLPELVSKENVQKAFRYVTGTNAMVSILGGVAAGSMVGFFGIDVSLILNVLSFMIIAMMMYFITPQFSIVKNRKTNQKFYSFIENWKNEFYDGVRFIHHKRQLKTVLIVLFALQFFIAPLEIAIPFFVKKYLHETSIFFGALLSMEGIGIVLASVLIRFFENYIKKDRVIFYGIVLSAIGIFLLGFYPNKKFSLFFILLNGCGMTAASIIFNTSLLSIIPEKYRSRFFTILYFAEGLAAPMGLFFAGQVIDLFGITKTFMLMGVSLFCLILIDFYAKTFSFLNLQETVLVVS